MQHKPYFGSMHNMKTLRKSRIYTLTPEGRRKEIMVLTKYNQIGLAVFTHPSGHLIGFLLFANLLVFCTVTVVSSLLCCAILCWPKKYCCAASTAHVGLTNTNLLRGFCSTCAALESEEEGCCHRADNRRHNLHASRNELL